jgi:protocatechuate 4,5-dioxygenase alpha chain
MKQRNWRLDMPDEHAYWMNKVLYEVHHDAGRLQRYRASPDEYMCEVPLPAVLKAAIRDNDIGTMYLAGVNPYLLRAHCLGLGIPEPVFVQSLMRIASAAAEGGLHG